MYYFEVSAINEYIKIVDIIISLRECEKGESLVLSTGLCEACERDRFSDRSDLSGISICEDCWEADHFNCY